MKGRATIIGHISASGRSYASRPISGRSSVRGQVPGRVLPGTCPLTDAGSASRTRETGILHFLRVQPEQPQEIMWLTPQVGIDYHIETSTDLDWIIK